jgi:hypothetical protein
MIDRPVQSLSSAPQLRRLATILVVVQALILGFFVAGTHGLIVPLKGATSTDFVSFYAAGALALRGDAAGTYERAVHYPAEEAATARGIEYQTYLYPPTFMLLCAPLAGLPYLVAFVLFELVSGVFWLRMATRAAGGGRAASMALLAVPSVFWVMGIGQNSFLSAGLMALGMLLLARRPWAAGAAFGAICFKPHLGLLIPVALLAGRQWRAACGAALTVVALIGASVLLFGAAAWAGYLHMVLHLHDTVEGQDIHFFGHVDGYGVARLAGFSEVAADGFQIVLGVAAVAAVGVLWWRRGTPAEVRYAALAAGVLMVTPFALFYDLLMCAVSGAWLVRAGRAGRFLRGEKFILVLAFALDFLSYPLAKWTHVGLGVLVSPMLLGLAVRRGVGGEAA